ncbi:receptor-type guanylate cyclase Gyc76C-like isoform X2 [Oppia nitens]|uniref:receptor-type guanylate cyclase Gyc76C-like isoform X2 n=1 Tax=Oppia nitens TaxID=1686743 RepID=UPI0023DBA157|nr:receptor-type guanylate cyclase Gyc76C-like isoform X2 [Oppia nitens]
MLTANKWLLLLIIKFVLIVVYMNICCFAQQINQDLDDTTESDTELLTTLLSLLSTDNNYTNNTNTISAFRALSDQSYQLSSSNNETIKIGYLTNFHGRQNVQRQGIVISGAITYAISKVNANATILNGRKLEFIFSDTNGSTIDGTAAILSQWKQGVVAFFGPEDSCEVEATIAAALQLPMISYKCADSKVSRKDLYSTFARTHPPDTQIVRSVIALLSYFHWNKFSIIWENTAQYKTVFKSLREQAVANDFVINSDRSFENYYDCCIAVQPCCRRAFLDIIEETYRGTRIYVFLGKTSDLHRMMLVLRMRGLFENGEYIVIYVDLEEEYLRSQSYKYINTRFDISEDEKRALADAAQSLLVIVPSPPNGTDYTAFEDKVREFNSRPPFNLPEMTYGNVTLKRHITIYASYLYDSVMLYCEALAQAFRDGLNEYNGRSIIRNIIEKKRYLSVTGAWMNIDDNGDVEGNYTVLARWRTPVDLPIKGMAGHQRPSHVMLPVGNFEYDEFMNRTVFKLEGNIDWVSGNPPLVEPPCGFDGSGCLEAVDNKREIIAGVLIGLLVTVIIVTGVTYRNWKYEQEIAGLLWKINVNELMTDSYDHLLAASQMSIASQASVDSRFYNNQVFTQRAIYRGAFVAVKQLKFTKRIDISRTVKKEMKIMKEINHDNVNQFIGASIEVYSVLLATEYCAKGSLYDILENDNYKLDSMFQTSLVFDLISGMIFLHDSDIKFHGNLKSSNCVVTSRWVLQVADFGLHQLRANAAPDPIMAGDPYRDLLWKAPELLRDSSLGGNQKADVYAFAIILHEIMAREGPFGINEKDITCKQIVSQIKEYDRLPEPFRPDLNLVQWQDFVRQTMQDCWTEKIDLRPDFRTIRSRLKKLRQGLKSNIMDNMTALLEKYATNLEEIVDERTSQLVDEKKKTESLLDRMLPRSVAAQLMRDEPVMPESYDAVTIFFSDIVGFTSMSADSTPMQVVTFLNDLYTLFDSIICNYEVYKVETIGDAYMVVSGLPIRIGDAHAAEIASMALEMLESVKSFKIRHRPDDLLQLRIGIHTGPVVAGVVGRTMPRYCLFGDTVNTASRMESNGEALKIHISPQCRDYLVRLGGYVIEDRGFVTMKGKGQVLTYWLVSHTTGQMHRRESAPDDYMLLQNYGYPDKKRPNNALVGLLPRKGSIVGFKNSGKTTNDGSNLNVSTARLPAFLRSKGHESNGSLVRPYSPKLNKKPFPSSLRHSRLALKDQLCDNNNKETSFSSTIVQQMHSKTTSIPRNASSVSFKTSHDRFNSFNEQYILFGDNDYTNHTNNHINDSELSQPLLNSDHNHDHQSHHLNHHHYHHNNNNSRTNHNYSSSSGDLNIVTDCCANDNVDIIINNIITDRPLPPLINHPLIKLDNIIASKKWNSCTQLDLNNKSINNNNNQSSISSVADNSHNNCNDNNNTMVADIIIGNNNNKKFDPTVKDWSKISLVDCNQLIETDLTLSSSTTTTSAAVDDDDDDITSVRKATGANNLLKRRPTIYKFIYHTGPQGIHFS